MASAYRINRRYEQAGTDAREADAAGQNHDAEDRIKAYADRLVGLIPGDIIALYLVGANLLQPNSPNATSEDRWGTIFWAGFCLFCLIALRVWGTRDKDHKAPVEWCTITIAVGAYLIWLYNIGCPVDSTLGIPNRPKIGILLMIGYTFLVPIVYHGDKFDGITDESDPDNPDNTSSERDS